ncbi:O-antigen ligase family protein [Nocardioides montaniterrae]
MSLQRSDGFDPRTADPTDIRLPLVTTDGRDNETKAFEFVLFAAMGFSSVAVKGLPVGELALGLVTLLAMTKRPTRLPPPLMTALIAAVPTWMLAAAVIDGVSPYRRLLHLALWGLLALCIGQGRIHLQTMARGFATGLVVSLGAGLFGQVARNEHGAVAYSGRLTGYVGDPNTAGYYVLVLGLVACAYMGSRRQVVLFLMTATPLLVLTWSRTSLFAATACVVWLLIGHRISPVLGVLFLSGLVYGFARFPDTLKQIGPFSDRNGSDELRRRIDAGAAHLVDTAGLTGHGPGTSLVPDWNQPGNFWFFHNSYNSIINEGGWIAFALVIGLLVITMLLLTRLEIRHRNGWVEAALISLSVVAINLGEVLLELPAAVALGAAAYHLGRPPAAVQEEREERQEMRWPF